MKPAKKPILAIMPPSADARRNSELIERINAALSASGKAARRACLDAKLSPNFIGQIRSGATYSPSASNLRKLAASMRVNEAWLISGTGEMRSGVAAAEPSSQMHAAVFLDIVKKANAEFVERRLELDEEQMGEVYRALIRTYDQGDEIEKSTVKAAINALELKWNAD